MEAKKRKTGKYIAFAVILIVAAAAFLYFTGQFGVSAADIESDARKNQKIDKNWTMISSSGECAAAMLFYDEILGEYKTSVYADPDNRPFGWFYIAGGCTNDENEGIVEYSIADCREKAYMSMNLQRVALLVIENGQEVKEIELDPERPFVRVLPEDTTAVTFYNEKHNPMKVLTREIG